MNETGRNDSPFEKGGLRGILWKKLFKQSPLTPVRKVFLNNGAGPLCQRGDIQEGDLKVI